MYDNIDFKIKSCDVTRIDFLKETPKHFEVTGEHDFYDSLVISGSLNGYKITVSERCVNVKDGSLCKFYLGDNFQTLNRSDVKKAIEMLSDTLHLPFEQATVSRIDAAQNFIVKHPTEVYFNHLGEYIHNKRLAQPNGLYYTNPKGLLIFYDKLKEQKDKGQNIPKLYKDRFTLRYEQRHKARLKDTFNAARVTGAMLYDEAFYMQIINKWHDAYKSIKKINDVNINFNAMTGKKDLYMLGLASLIFQQGGELNLLQQIKEAQQRQDLTKKQARDLRQAIKEASQCNIGMVQNDAILELNKKIDEAVKFYR